MVKIIVLASGSGTNAENIIKYFKKKNDILVTKVLCNRKDAKVFERCKRLNVECLLFNKKELFESNKIIDLLIKEADYVILAGFLLKIPKTITDKFKNKIINIHPALLPKYGGKGMYGMNVHNAVYLNKEKETGITIHYVNENYDEGAIIFQAKTSLNTDDTPEKIAEKIHSLEQKYFPEVIEKEILKYAK